MEVKDPNNYERTKKMSFFIGEQMNRSVKVGKKTYYDADEHCLYFKKWRIDLNHLELIQDHPEVVITRKQR